MLHKRQDNSSSASIYPLEEMMEMKAPADEIVDELEIGSQTFIQFFKIILPIFGTYALPYN